MRLCSYRSLVDDRFILGKEQYSRRLRAIPGLLHPVAVAVGVNSEAIVDILLAEKLWVEVVYHGQDVPDRPIVDQGVVVHGAAMDEIPPRGPPPLM